MKISFEIFKLTNIATGKSRFTKEFSDGRVVKINRRRYKNFTKLLADTTRS